MSQTPAWVHNSQVLWQHRRLLAKVLAYAAGGALAIALLLPKQYESAARIMPPANANSSSALMAAFAGKALGSSGSGLTGLAGSLLGSGNTTALYMDLIRSGTISGHLIDRFNLMSVYGKRYRIDTAKKLARMTTVSEEKRSGVITISVRDRDAVRARDMAQAYLDELNLLLNRTATTSAHQERVFLDKRLQKAHEDLRKAQQELGDFATRNTTIDIKEQTRAMVEAGARVQAELIVEQSSLSSMRQVYGDDNVRVRSAQARIGMLQNKLNALTGSASPENNDAQTDQPYPALRRLPQLAIPYAELYRNLRIQETVFELLTQQYELSRIEEAKDIPVVAVIDYPGVAEKKAFPPRTLLTLALTFASFLGACVFLLLRDRWRQTSAENPRKQLLETIVASATRRMRRTHQGVTV